MVDIQAVKHVDDSIKSAGKADGQDGCEHQTEQRAAAHHAEPAEPTVGGARPAPSGIDQGDPLDDGQAEDEKRTAEEAGAIAWAQRISSFGDLGDKRRHDRMGKILAGLAMQPHASIPASTLDRIAADSTYEFFKNENFKTANVVDCIALATADSCKELDVVYAIQDTTEFNYSNLKTTTGLGPVNDSPRARGLHCHSTVAVDIKGILRGPLDIDIWARAITPPAAKAPKSPAAAKKQANANDQSKVDNQSTTKTDAAAGELAKAVTKSESAQKEKTSKADKQADSDKNLETRIDSIEAETTKRAEKARNSKKTKTNKNKQANASKKSESDAAGHTKMATQNKTAKNPKGKKDNRAKEIKRARTKEEKAKERKRKKKKRNDERPIEEKESYKWIKGMDKAHKLFADKPVGARPRLIHVMDREGDVHEVFEKLEQLEGDSAIIRCSQNRAVDGQTQLAHAAVRECEVLGTIQLTVSASKEHSAHEATLEIRATTVTLNPSKKKHPNRKKVTLNLVEVWEPNPPEGSQAICWRLWTLEPAGTFEEALAVVKGYSYRWRIEEYHLALKSGSNVEKLELSTADRLMRAIVLYAPVAMRVVTLRDLGRRAPDSPCTIMFSDTEWRALQSEMSKKEPADSDKPPTIRQMMLWIGKLGGHQGRKSDGLPGIRTLWRGCEKLTMLVMGYQKGLKKGYQRGLAQAARAERSSATDPPGVLEACMCQ